MAPRPSTVAKAMRSVHAQRLVEQREGGTQRRKARKKGPPARVFDREKKAVFLSLLGHGFSATRAARYAGVSVATARTHYRNDDDFKRLWDEAMDTGCDLIDHEILAIGTAGRDERVRLDALKFLARARRPEVYSESQKLQVTDDRGKAPTKERLAELREQGMAAGENEELTAAIELVAAAFADHATTDATPEAEALPEPEADDD